MKRLAVAIALTVAVTCPGEWLPVSCNPLVAEAAARKKKKKTNKKTTSKAPALPRVQPKPPREDGTPIFGTAQIDAAQMTEWVRRRNPDFDPAIAEAFIEVGNVYGIRGDIALCQSIIETGWFLFGGGTAVTPDQHNYCGLGVTQKGVKGAAFDTVRDGVTAQLQHLYAYAASTPLPGGETVIDPRFDMVPRGCAPSWEDLNLRWAMNDAYGESILAVYAAMTSGIDPSDPTRLKIEEIGIPLTDELESEIYGDLEQEFVPAGADDKVTE